MNLALVPHLSTIIIAFEDGTGEVLPLPAGAFNHDGLDSGIRLRFCCALGTMLYMSCDIPPLDNNKEGFMLDN